MSTVTASENCSLCNPRITACTDLTEPYIFVSYCHTDTEKVCELLQVMQDNHFRFWYDEGIESGSQWADVLYERLVNCSQFVCFFTKASVESVYVKNEIHIAAKYGKPILPVFLDDVVLRGGLELVLDRQQFLSYPDHTPKEFHKKFCNALDRHAVRNISTMDSSAKASLEASYQLDNEIGGGFSGKVYTATGIRSGCRVIVKHATVDDSYIGNAIRIAYENECRALTSQVSCFAPLAIDYFTDESNIYLVESLLPGLALSKQQALTDGQIVQVFLKAAQVLKRFHDKGIVHCDIKPEHIFLHDGEVFLVDFGACYFMDSINEPQSIGSVYFAAPEQFVNAAGTPAAIDCRTDIYALGRSLLFTLAKHHGTLSVIDEEKTTILGNGTTFASKQTSFSLDSKRYRSEVSPLLRAVVDKMTAQDPKQRFESMDEVITCLENI